MRPRKKAGSGFCSQSVRRARLRPQRLFAAINFARPSEAGIGVEDGSAGVSRSNFFTNRATNVKEAKPAHGEDAVASASGEIGYQSCREISSSEKGHLAGNDSAACASPNLRSANAACRRPSA